MVEQGGGGPGADRVGADREGADREGADREGADREGLTGVLGVRPLPAVRPGDPFPAVLVLLRHGESAGNAAERAARTAGATHLDLAQPDAAVPLTDLGRAQAAAVGRWLTGPAGEARRPDLVLTSPYRRALETAGAVLGAAAFEVPLHSDERLRERDLGIFDGLTGFGIRAQHPEEGERRGRLGKVWYRPPGGESWADVVLRVRSFVATELPRHAGSRVLLVTHQAVVMAFRIVLEGLGGEEAVRIDTESPQANCALTTYGSSPGGPRLLGYGDTAAVERSPQPVTEEPGADVHS